jgi:Uma2 family endonuclease
MARDFSRYQPEEKQASILEKKVRDKALLGVSDLQERDTQGVAMFERSSDKTISYYYDSHPTEEDLMGESSQHHAVIGYLEELLKWLFHNQACAVYANLNFYITDDEDEYPIVPDVAVIEGVSFRHEISWRIGVTGPAPQVVFEMASDKTWKRDLDEKPHEYAAIGVQEYYAFDPFEPPLPLSRRKGRRLFGWHVDADSGLMRQVPPRPDGSLWSPQLNSWLKPDGMYLRLYDLFGHRRLTKGEVDEAKAERAEWEALARQAEAERAEREALRAQEATQRAEAFAKKLRELGIDPDQPL